MLAVEPIEPEQVAQEGEPVDQVDVQLDDRARSSTRRSPRRRQPSIAVRLWQVTWPKLAAIGLALLIWQAVVWSGWRPEFVLPSPFTVFKRLGELIADGTVADAIIVTRAGAHPAQPDAGGFLQRVGGRRDVPVRGRVRPGVSPPRRLGPVAATRSARRAGLRARTTRGLSAPSRTGNAGHDRDDGRGADVARTARRRRQRDPPLARLVSSSPRPAPRSGRRVRSGRCVR